MGRAISVAMAAVLGLVVACGDDDGAPAERKSVSRLVGPAGGTVELRGGVKVEIPEDALTEMVEIKVSELEDEAVQPLPSNLAPAGKPFAFTPHGTTFSRPVKVTIEFEPDAEDEPTSVRPVKAEDEDSDDWRTIVGSDKDDEQKTLSFDVMSFSVLRAARPDRDSGVITLPDGAIAQDSAMPETDSGSDTGVLDSGFDAGFDASDACVACETGLLALAISGGTFSPAFSTEQVAYDVIVPLATQTIALQPTLGVDTTIEINGEAVGSGDTWVSPVLDLGSNTVVIDVDRAGEAPIAYALLVNRGATDPETYVKSSNSEANDEVGSAVAIDGDTLVVGASAEASSATGVNGDASDNRAPNSGAAYVFVRGNNGRWTQQAYLKASNTGATDNFGVSVAIDGNTLVVGAPNEASSATGVDGDGSDNSLSSAGAAYVFVRSGTTWSQQAYVKASNTDGYDIFGNAIALDGNTLAVGAHYESSDGSSQANNSLSYSGAVYVFARSGTTWTQQAYLKAAHPDYNDEFGTDVDLDGDRLVVGAIGESSNATGVNGDQTDNSAQYAGAAYVFLRSGTTWSQEAYLKPSNTNTQGDVEDSDHFGESVAIDGNTIVVGGYGEDSRGIGLNGDQSTVDGYENGAAYVYALTVNGWAQTLYVKSSNNDDGDYFARHVAISDGTFVCAAPYEAGGGTGIDNTTPGAGDNSVGYSGAVYIYE